MRIKDAAISVAVFATTVTVVFAPPASAGAYPPSLHAVPAVVLPGQTIEFSLYCAGRPSTPVTSPGLVAPVVIGTYVNSAKGTAGRYPGRYTATFTCAGFIEQYGGTATAEFEIVCVLPPALPSTPPASSETPSPSPDAPTATSAPRGSTTPPVTSTSPAGSASVEPAAFRPTRRDCGGRDSQVPVRPKGAPETGDGSVAGQHRAPSGSSTPAPGTSRLSRTSPSDLAELIGSRLR